VRLVFRNVGKTEHHYRIIGMEAAEMLWMVGPDDMQTPEGVTLEERELHHLSGWAPFKLESPAGIKPFGDEVHAYAPAHDKDVLLFTPTQKGTFEVECPLHAEAVGKIVVF
jgi:hypothetical protein